MINLSRSFVRLNYDKKHIFYNSNYTNLVENPGIQIKRLCNMLCNINSINNYCTFRITRIYEILVQDIGSAKNIWETSSLQFKIGKYCGIPWELYISASEGVTHQPQVSLRLLLLLVLIYAGNFEKFYEWIYYILLHFCQRTTYIRALAEVGLDVGDF